MFINNVKKQRNKKNATFALLTKDWLENKKKLVKESTFSNYSYVINKYLMCEFQNMSIKSLESMDFNEFVDRLTKSLKSKTVRDILVILKSILRYSNDKYSSDINVKNIKAPKLNQNLLNGLTKEEKGKLEKYCLKENSLKSIGIIVCLNTGLRIGEICAMHWKDIDLDKKEIRVRFTLQRIYDKNLKNTKVIIDSPKTKNSTRNIPMSNKLYYILKPLKKDYNDDEFFFNG